MDWMWVNKLELNPDNVLWINPIRSGNRNSIIFPLKTQVRSLGVLLDSSLSLYTQILEVAMSAYTQLKLVHRLHPFLEMSNLAMMTYALVISCLDYYNILYVELFLEDVLKL